jgi:hypothetical protein
MRNVTLLEFGLRLCISLLAAPQVLYSAVKIRLRGCFRGNHHRKSERRYFGSRMGKEVISEWRSSKLKPGQSAPSHSFRLLQQHVTQHKSIIVCEIMGRKNQRDIMLRGKLAKLR